MVAYILTGWFKLLGSEAKGGWMWRKGDCREELVVTPIHSKTLSSLCGYFLFDFSLTLGGLYHRIVTRHMARMEIPVAIYS